MMRRILAAFAVFGLGIGVTAVVTAQTEPEPPVEHVSVRAGEGVWAVARRLCPHDVAAQFHALQGANSWTVTGPVYPGAVLHLPVGSCPAPTTTTTTEATTSTEQTTSTTATSAPPTTVPPTTTSSSSSSTTSEPATTSTTSTTLPPPSGFPTRETTGPRFAPTQTLPRTFSTANGQVIERVVIEDQLTIRHDNVTVRDVTVMGDRTYMIHVQPKADGSGCPQNVVIEYTEVDGTGSPEKSYAVRGQAFIVDGVIVDGCGFTFDHSTVVNVNRGINVTSNATISNSYVEVSDSPAAGDHRNGIMTNGGQHLTFTGNTVICTNGACSAAISLFGDFARIDDVLIQGNLVATSGVYCIRGGAEPHESFPEPTNVRIVGNHFSRSINSNCGTSQPIASHENNVRGNVCHSNVWADTGLPADESC